MIRDYKKGGADMGDKPPEKGPAARKPTAAGGTESGACMMDKPPRKEPAGACRRRQGET